MRLFEFILLSLCIAGLHAHPTLPRLVSVQLHRCPVETYYNTGAEELVELKIPSSYNHTYLTEFDEVIRLQPDETGTIQFFVTGSGNFSVRPTADPKVFDGIGETVYSDPKIGGVVFEQRFKVKKGVLDTIIAVVMFSGDIKKITRLVVNTKSMDPPRPPQSYPPTRVTDGETTATDVITRRPTSTTVQVTAPTTSFLTPSIRLNSSVANVSASRLLNENVTLPYFLEAVHRTWTTPSPIELRLDSINVNRISLNYTDKYVSKDRLYVVGVSKKETGFFMFYVSGRGKKTVTIQTVAPMDGPTKVMQVDGDYAASSYFVSEETDHEHFVVRVTNDYNDVLYFGVMATTEY